MAAATTQAAGGETVQERLEKLVQALQAERDRSAGLERELAVTKSTKLAQQQLVVLSASKDLWRGNDESRPERPDNIGSAPGRVGAPPSAPDESAPLIPSSRDAMEAAVARALRAQDASSAAP